jgi:hypothetical protein
MIVLVPISVVANSYEAKAKKVATEADTSMDPLLLFMVLDSSVRLTLCGR